MARAPRRQKNVPAAQKGVAPGGSQTRPSPWKNNEADPNQANTEENKHINDGDAADEGAGTCQHKRVVSCSTIEPLIIALSHIGTRGNVRHYPEGSSSSKSAQKGSARTERGPRCLHALPRAAAQALYAVSLRCHVGLQFGEWTSCRESSRRAPWIL